MQIQTRTITNVLNVSNGISLSQSVTAGSKFLINGSLAIGGSVSLSPAQNVSVASSGNDSAVIFTVSGMDENGLITVENIVGANIGISTTYNYFSEVTSIVAHDNTASTVIAGVMANTGAVTTRMVMNRQQRDFRVGYGVSLSDIIDGFIVLNTANLAYTIQHAMVDAFSNTMGGITWYNGQVVAQTSATSGNYIVPVSMIRLKLNGYVSGTATISVLEGM
jgi:hypothetical protein